MKKTIQCATWVSRRFISQILYVCRNQSRTRTVPTEKKLKLMKSRPDNITDDYRLSVEAGVLNARVQQTFNPFEGNVTAPGTAWLTNTRSDGVEHSVPHPILCRRKACFHCPHRPDNSSGEKLKSCENIHPGCQIGISAGTGGEASTELPKNQVNKPKV